MDTLKKILSQQFSEVSTSIHIFTWPENTTLHGSLAHFDNSECDQSDFAQLPSHSTQEWLLGL